MTDNVRKEFSLDYCQTLLETYGMDTARAYKDCFVLQRKINRLQKKYWIEDWAKFDQEVYNKRFQDRWIVYASEYREYFMAKNDLIRNMKKLRFQTNEEIDEEVEQFEPERWDEEPDEMPNIETKKRKDAEANIELLRQQYLEKFGKPVTNFKKNDAERIKNKLAE